MIEPEMAFADLDDDMCLAEGMLKYIIRFVLEHAPEEMNFFNQDVYKRQDLYPASGAPSGPGHYHGIQHHGQGHYY